MRDPANDHLGPPAFLPRVPQTANGKGCFLYRKPKSDHSAWANWQPADFTPVAVQHLPWKFCDDDIISVPVQVRSTPSTTKEQHGERCGIAGWKSKLKKHQSGKSSSTVKVLRMTRGEYLKYWARDEQGNYCGTEPEGVGEGLWKDRMN